MINQIRTRVGVENWAHAHTKKKVLSFDSTLYIYIYFLWREKWIQMKYTYMSVPISVEYVKCIMVIRQVTPSLKKKEEG